MVVGEWSVLTMRKIRLGPRGGLVRLLLEFLVLLGLLRRLFQTLCQGRLLQGLLLAEQWDVWWNLMRNRSCTLVGCSDQEWRRCFQAQLTGGVLAQGRRRWVGTPLVG